jgi:hypothetical protein
MLGIQILRNAKYPRLNLFVNGTPAIIIPEQTGVPGMADHPARQCEQMKTYG